MSLLENSLKMKRVNVVMKNLKEQLIQDIVSEIKNVSDCAEINRISPVCYSIPVDYVNNNDVVSAAIFFDSKHQANCIIKNINDLGNDLQQIITLLENCISTKTVVYSQNNAQCRLRLNYPVVEKLQEIYTAVK